MPFRILIYALFLSTGMIYVSCGENEDPVIVITDEDIIGKWTFTEIKGSTAGMTDTDNDPQGFVEFSADGTGVSQFSTDLLGFTFAEDQVITWERVGDNQVYITPLDGNLDIWTVTNVGTDMIEASWDVVVGGISSGTINAKMVR
jgi:hypothetical protein